MQEEICNNRSFCIDKLDRLTTMPDLETAIKELERDKSVGHYNVINEFIVN